MRLSKLEVSKYKCFDKFTVTFGENAFLVGPNNAGKSTLIEAAMLGAGAGRIAARRRPETIAMRDSQRIWKYPLNAEALGMQRENLRHQFRNIESSLSLTFDSGSSITCVWPADPDDDDGDAERPYFFVSRKNHLETSSKPGTAKDLLPSICVIPTLSPVPDVEELLEADYIERYAGASRASLHLRNHIFRIREAGELPEFLEWIGEHLPEIGSLSIRTRMGATVGRTELDLFYSEPGQKTPHELCWAGDGIQIYLQILTHLWRNRTADVIILDEPDVFLHADLQRRLVRLLEAMPAQAITATHSPEMLAEASHEAVVWVDKQRKRAIRRPDAASLDDLSSRIGSQFNLRLAGALRSKAVVFLEGQDMTLLKRIALTLDCTMFAGEQSCTVIPMQGFDRWQHVEPFRWLMSDFLHKSVRVFVILDRDYRLDDEIDDISRALAGQDIRCTIWKRKELESYLLEPSCLARLSKLTVTEVSDVLAAITEGMVDDERGHFIASHSRAFGGKKAAPATVLNEGLAHFTPLFQDSDWRLRRFPAKDILSAFNRELQGRNLKAVSAQRIAGSLVDAEIDLQMRNTLKEIESVLGSK